MVGRLVTSGRKKDIRGVPTESEGNEEKEAPKMSVSRNEPVQTNGNAPAHPRLAIVKDLTFETLVLALIPVHVGAYSWVVV